MTAKRTIACMALAVLLAACASYEHKSVQYDAPTALPNAVEIDGVSVAADAIETEAEAIANFDEPVTKKGFYPVKVVVSNQSADRVLVLRDTVTLRTAGGQTFSPVSAVVMAEAVEDNAIAYAVLGFGIFSYASAKDANEERTADYQNKELKEAKIVEPGRQHGAFVYFQLPAGVDIGSSVLEIGVQHVGTSKVSSFEISL